MMFVCKTAKSFIIWRKRIPILFLIVIIIIIFYFYFYFFFRFRLQIWTTLYSINCTTCMFRIVRCIYQRLDIRTRRKSQFSLFSNDPFVLLVHHVTKKNVCIAVSINPSFSHALVQPVVIFSWQRYRVPPFVFRLLLWIIGDLALRREIKGINLSEVNLKPRETGFSPPERAKLEMVWELSIACIAEVSFPFPGLFFPYFSLAVSLPSRALM